MGKTGLRLKHPLKSDFRTQVSRSIFKLNVLRGFKGFKSFQGVLSGLKGF